MSILDAPVATYSRSELRKAEVADAAQRGPVEIRNPGGDLVLVARTEIDRIRDLHDAASSFLRASVELRRSAPSPIILGEMSFAASWSLEDREHFLERYAEAVDASLRANDPGPVHLFIATMQSPPRASDRPDFDGHIAEDSAALVASRLSS